ncbi:hypothetical protein Bca101_017676 [Brassica carinata]
MRRWFGSYDPEDLNLREMDRLLIEKRRSEDTQKSQKLLNLLSLEVLQMSTTRIHNDSANISGKVEERTAKRCKGILVEGRLQVTLSNNMMLQEHLFMTCWRGQLWDLPFEDTGIGIYHVSLALDDKTQEHALHVLTRGVTDDGVDFVVVHNSWGVTFDMNKGYCRFFLPIDGASKYYAHASIS